MMPCHTLNLLLFTDFFGRRVFFPAIDAVTEEHDE